MMIHRSALFSPLEASSVLSNRNLHLSCLGLEEQIEPESQSAPFIIPLPPICPEAGTSDFRCESHPSLNEVLCVYSHEPTCQSEGFSMLYLPFLSGTVQSSFLYVEQCLLDDSDLLLDTILQHT